MDNKTEVLLVGFDYTKEKDQTILVVSRRIKKQVGPFNRPVTEQQIINTFSGKEAMDLYNKLTGESE